MKVNEYGKSRGLTGVAPDQDRRDRRDQSIHDLIEDIRGKEGVEYQRALKAAVSALLPMFDRWAPLICRSHGDFSYTYRDDIVSVAAENAVKILTEEGLKERHPTNWMPYLRRMMQNRSHTFFVSGEMGFVSGTTMLKRRKTLAKKYADELRFLIDREPTVDEVIEYANDILRNTRLDPERQSALLSAEDFEPEPRQVSFDSLENVTGSDSDQTMIVGSEGQAIVRSIIEECARLSDDHGLVARLWVGDLYGVDPIIRKSADIAKSTGLPPALVDSMLSENREVAQTISRQKYGIDFAA